jgi:hypothetical protein
MIADAANGMPHDGKRVGDIVNTQLWFAGDTNPKIQLIAAAPVLRPY